MTYRTIQNRIAMWPYLALASAGILTGTGILIHSIVAVFTYGYISPIEGIIGTVGQLLGFVALIVMVGIISSGKHYDKNTAIFAIIMLVLYIGVELVLWLLPDFMYYINPWISLAILLVFGIIRGLTFQKTNQTLKIPRPNYNTGALGLYGWSFLITTFLGFLFVIIGAYAYNYQMIIIGEWIIIGQLFLDALSLLIVGITFVISAINKPFILRSTTIQETSTPSITSPSISAVNDFTQTSGTTKSRNCQYCGGIIPEDSDYCPTCGVART